MRSGAGRRRLAFEGEAIVVASTGAARVPPQEASYEGRHDGLLDRSVIGNLPGVDARRATDVSGFRADLMITLD
jgi:hypothetical protein